MKLARSQHTKEFMKDQPETGTAPVKGLARLSAVLKHSTRFTCACIVLFSARNNAIAAPLAVGTTIGIDCGPTPTANWNNFSESATIEAGAVRDLKGTIIDGVSISLAGGFFNNDGVALWKADSAVSLVDLPNTVTGDLVGAAGEVTITLRGLDLDLAYNLSALTAAKLAWDRIDTVTVVGSDAALTSKLPRGQSAQSGMCHSFLNLRPNAKGVIQLTVSDASGNRNPVINLVLLEPIHKSEAGGSVATDPAAMRLVAQQYEARMKSKSERIAELQTPEKLYPKEKRVHEGVYLTAVDFPVGAVGGSVIRLNGKAERQWWQIFNNHEERPGTGKVPNSFFAIRTEQGARTEVRALQTSAVGAFQPMQSLKFWSEFPFGVYEFADAKLPVAVELEAYSFLIPMDLKNSAIPSAVFRYTVKNTSSASVEISLLAAQQNAVGFSGYDPIKGANNRSNPGYGSNRNKIVKTADRSSLKMTGDAGSMVLSAYAQDTTHSAAWDSMDALHNAFAGSGKLSGPQQASSPGAGVTVDGALAKHFSLAPGAEQTVTFVLSWHIPEGTFGRADIPTWYFQEAGSQYENWWANAAEVDDYVSDHFSELDKNTRLYRDSLYASNLPRYVLDRVSSNISVLKSPTSFWTKDGYFGIWESTSSKQEWFGNCKHVLHYAQGQARLFPELDRILRQQDLASMTNDGLLSSRDGELKNAMDGHYGAILGVYRAHLLSTGDGFAKDKWPEVEKAMDYAIRTFDPDQDGMLSGTYHNTLDCNSSGTSPWIGSLYLAALEASAELAQIAGNTAKAEAYTAMVEKGRVNQNAQLWDEELGYYVERPEFLPGTRIMGNGASVDMFLGQWWANQLDLGPIYPHDRTVAALGRLFEGNLVTDDGQYRTRYRDFLGRGDSGWRMVAFPGAIPKNALSYHDEVMSGFEYSMAATMMQYGMIEEGLTIVRAIYDRYDGRLRASGEVRTRPNATVFGTGSPVGEDECGDYYARALSSWSTLLALQGFSYNGPDQSIGFQPVWQPEDHRSFFTAAEGWGLFSQTRVGSRQTAAIDLKYGDLDLRTITLAVPDQQKVEAVRVSLDGKKLQIKSHEQTGQRVDILLPQSAQLQAGAFLQIDLDL
jgi:non-lysosomal glucosylceramidase